MDMDNILKEKRYPYIELFTRIILEYVSGNPEFA
jgi:hypothetical protein